MLHASLVIERLGISGRDLALEYGTVMVVARAEFSELDWEVLARTVETHPIARGTHDVTLACVDAVEDPDAAEGARLVRRAMSGPAFLVRVVDRTLVLRGTGSLEGFDLGLLRG